MKVAVLKETAPGESRVALVPEMVGRLKDAGLDVLVESGAGEGAWFGDAAYAEAGAAIVSRPELVSAADIILTVTKPDEALLGALRSGQTVIGMLNPLADQRLVGLGHRQDDVRRRDQLRPAHDRGAVLCVGSVVEPGRLARAGLDQHVQAGAFQPADHLGNKGDPALAGRGLLQDSDFHRRDLMFPGGVTWKAATQSGDEICRVGRPAISTTCAHDRHSNSVHMPKRPPLRAAARAGP